MMLARALKILTGGLWHTTSEEHFVGIVATGRILPEPDREGLIPRRYNVGPDSPNYPMVRHLGGVSLFDFAGFDPDAYSERYPVSAWGTFVPFSRARGASVWIEISRQAVAGELIDGARLLVLWKDGGHHGRNIMPMIEAAHIGPIPVAACVRAFVIREGQEEIETLRLTHGRASA